MDLSKEELEEWWHSKATQEVVKEFVKWRDAITTEMLDGRTLSDNAGFTAQMTARAVGEIAGLNYLIERKFVEDGN